VGGAGDEDPLRAARQLLSGVQEHRSPSASRERPPGEADACTLAAMDDLDRLLAAYDEQLRTDAETPGAVSVTRHGPLRLVGFAGGRGFVTYQDLGGADADRIGDLVAQALEHYRADPGIERVEWKTRGHDHAPGLHEALLANGFTPDEPESIMIGEARALAVDLALPDGVSARRVTEEADVRAMSAMQDEVFGDPPSDEMADALLRRLALADGMELWVAEADGLIVCAGRLEPVRGTTFAGIWGGATRPEWRGRGIYRALTALRARSALRLGKTLIHSDSTEYSRPILERSGLVKVSTTTPYLWRR
jgi:ribosomal protein S18 acetylase RimI-like enzyme